MIEPVAVEPVAADAIPENLFPEGPGGLLARARGLVLPFGMTALYASPWIAARRRERFERAGIPTPRTTFGVLAGVATDELCRAVFTLVRRPPSAEELCRIEAEADEAITLYREEGWLDDPRSYHRDPAAPAAFVESVRVDLTRLECLRFPSAYVPHAGEPGAERWQTYRPNDVVRAFMLRHPDGPRPWVVCVHGTEMGRPEVDRRLFRIAHLHRDLGVNVVMPVLPLHGRRRPARGVGTSFPTLDVLDNVHGLAQAASDVRSVIAWVREQSPSGIGVVGISLGGHVTALVAALEAPLDCVIAGMPVVDFPDLFRHNAPREVRGVPRYEALGKRSEQVHEVVSPLLATPATPVEGRFIFAGLADRLVDPVRHAAALWDHWERPTIHWFAGSHVAHLVDRGITRFVDDALVASGVTAI